MCGQVIVMLEDESEGIFSAPCTYVMEPNMAESLIQHNAQYVSVLPLARGLLIFVVSFACAVSRSLTNCASLQKVWNVLSNIGYVQQMITAKTQESCKLAV